MDAIIGIKGKDFVVLAADTNAARSIVKMDGDLDKVWKISAQHAIVVSGPLGDCDHLSSYIQRNLALNELRHGHTLSNVETANFIRTTLAQAIRRSPYQVNMFLGGVDADKNVDLYFLDYLGTLQGVPFGAQGYCSNFILATMDRHWVPDMEEEAVVQLLYHCFAELKERMIINFQNYNIKVIRSTGIEQIPNTFQ